jgi:hypothetical protein
MRAKKNPEASGEGLRGRAEDRGEILKPLGEGREPRIGSPHLGVKRESQ